jgi:hypothetical protein
MSNLTFEELVERARADDRVVGVFLGGSRAVGADVRPDSDHDVRLIVTAPVPELDRPRGEPVDVGVMELERFLDYPDWDRYTLRHARVLVDKTGEIQRVVDEKGRLTPDEAAERAPLALDAYMNSLYRGLKRPEGISGRLHQAESIGHLLTCLFALEGRVRPFHDYLEWELANYPLSGWDDLAGAIEGDQHELFRRVETHVRERGLGHVVDSWEPDVAFMRGER